MRPTEAVTLCRLAKAYWPHQTFDEFTADAWGDSLAPYRFVDCKAAMVERSRSAPFCAPNDIVAGVKRLRHDRVRAFGALPPPPADLDPDDTGAMQRWEIETTRRIADGELTNDNPQQLPQRNAPWDEATSPVFDAAETAARVREIREQLVKRKPTPERPLLAELASAATDADDKRAEAARDALATTTPERIRADVRAACAPREES